MSVKRYEVNGPSSVFEDENGSLVDYDDYATLEARCIALLAELEAKDKSISFLKDQLTQLANFNPDWDKLEAATDSLREHMTELTTARKQIVELSHHLQNAQLSKESEMATVDAPIRTARPDTLI